MKIYKSLPDLKKTRHMNLWHKALKSGWSPEEIEWESPGTPRLEASCDQVARILSPILVGEQAGLYSITSMIGILGKDLDVESQMYLTTMAVDEARHTELFTRFYRRIDREPLPIRRMPNGYLFQSSIISDDPLEWITGTLVSELSAKIMQEDLRALGLDPVLDEMCRRILIDETRHIAFNHIFVEDRFYQNVLSADGDASALATRLREKLESVLEKVGPVMGDIHKDCVDIGLEPDKIHAQVCEESRRRLDNSIASGLERASRAETVASTEPT